MESVQLIELNAATVFLLVLIGLIGGMVSGFIGSGGAFVLTPTMMALGAPAMVAVAERVKAGLADPDPAITGIVAEGRPDQVVIDEAREMNASLVVGSHGRTGLDRLLLGSIAERVIGFAECPVLAVKAA